MTKDQYSLGSLKIKIQEEFNKFQRSLNEHISANDIDVASINQQILDIEELLTINKISGTTDNSLCQQIDVSWQLLAPESAPTLQRLAGSDSLGYRSMFWLNRELTAVSGAALEMVFTVPSGVTSVKFSADIMAGVASNPIELQIYNAVGTTQLASESIVPGTLATYQTNSVSVVAGTEYRLRITCTSSGQADAIIGNARVVVENATSFFASPFVRLSATQMIDNNERGFSTVRYPNQSAYSHLDFITDAPEIVVEAYNNLGLYIIPPNDSLAIFVDEQPWTTIDPAIDRVSHTLVSLPNDNKRHHVQIMSGPQVSASSYESTPRGVHISAAYLPANATRSPALINKKNETWVVYGDSKTAGYYSDIPGRDGLVPLFRAGGRRVICEAYGGRALVSDVGTTLTVAACTPFARKLVRENPDNIIIAIGRNDFTGSAYSTGNWTSQLGNLLDAIHTVSPACKITLVKFTSETTENPNGLGATWTDWRGAMDTAASSRSEWCRVVSAERLWNTSNAANYTSDGVHPNSRGYSMLVSCLESWQPTVTGASDYLGTPNPWSPLSLGSGLKAWWSPNGGLTASTMGSVTSSGTAPPVVSLSGTPSFACSLIITITTGGILGTSKFRASIDNGRSWFIRDTATASSVVTDIGITITFNAGTYYTDNVYVSNARLSQINDLSGNGYHLTQASANKRFYYKLSGFNVPGRSRKCPAFLLDASAGTVMSRTMTLTNPFSIFSLAQITDQANIRTIVGGSAGLGIYCYSNTATTMAINGGAQIANTITATAPTVYGMMFGSSGELRSNGTQRGTGSAGTNSPTTFHLGGDDANSQWYWDNMIGDTIILDHTATTTEIAQIEAWYRSLTAAW